MSTKKRFKRELFFTNFIVFREERYFIGKTFTGGFIVFKVLVVLSVIELYTYAITF